jgi:hypothetical protein
MYGGLKKSVSLVALVAAAGIFSTGANAADLGGDCCADLEERVAELEATTARKGNRRMGLTIWGAVNRTIMSWDAPADGASPTSGTYLGLDNTNFATRFGFRGNARVAPTVTAGYSIVIDVFTGGTTARASRVSEEGGNVNLTNSRFDDHLMRMRDANVWMESSTFGRVTLGRLTGAGAVGTIDLAGIGNVASSGVSLAGGALSFANGTALATVTDQLGDFGYRQDGVRWDSPALAGFTLSASLGETLRESVAGAAAPAVDGRLYGVALRYAGEFSGVRVAAGIGYEKAVDEASTPANHEATHWGGSLALQHVATGLFIQGDYVNFERLSTAAFGGVGANVAREGNRYIIQAGIGQNWFGIGRTTLYGEYARHSHDQSLFAATAGATRVTTWGLGITQDIDAAAMQLYAGYRNHSLTEAAVGQGDIGIFLAGARINF